jgi:hypothetical protein
LKIFKPFKDARSLATNEETMINREDNRSAQKASAATNPPVGGTRRIPKRQADVRAAGKRFLE